MHHRSDLLNWNKQCNLFDLWDINLWFIIDHRYKTIKITKLQTNQLQVTDRKIKTPEKININCSSMKVNMQYFRKLEIKGIIYPIINVRVRGKFKYGVWKHKTHIYIYSFFGLIGKGGNVSFLFFCCFRESVILISLFRNNFALARTRLKN